MFSAVISGHGQLSSVHEAGSGLGDWEVPILYQQMDVSTPTPMARMSLYRTIRIPHGPFSNREQAHML